MNSQPAPEPKTVFFALVFHAWQTSKINVIDLGRSVEFNTKDLLQHPNAVGFFPVYETLEALRADYPNAPLALAHVSFESPQRPACCDGVMHIVRECVSEPEPKLEKSADIKAEVEPKPRFKL